MEDLGGGAPSAEASRDAGTKKTKQHKAAETASRKAHKEGAGSFFAWLDDGVDRDTARMLRREVPAPVLWLLTHLGGRDYRRRVAPIWA